MEFKADTLDDALRAIMARLLKSGHRTLAGKGAALEFTSVLVTLTDPRARFSRTEDRSTLFSCLGETLWYISGSDRLDHISYYIPHYRRFIGASPRARKAPGAYGPRLFGGGDRSQIAEIVAILKAKQGRSDTRQAVAQIFSRSDLTRSKGDVPCTTTIQFLPRRGRLHVVATMRSNDAYRGLPHDVFAFSFIQEMVARILGLEVGTYSHFVGSLHLYEDDMMRARDFLAEGWQTPAGMPPMPPGDPTPQLAWLLRAEASIRLGHAMPDPEGVHPYWLDLTRILHVKRSLRDGDLRTVLRLKNEMSDNVFAAFIRNREVAASARIGALAVTPTQPDLPGVNQVAALSARQEGSSDEPR